MRTGYGVTAVALGLLLVERIFQWTGSPLWALLAGGTAAALGVLVDGRTAWPRMRSVAWCWAAGSAIVPSLLVGAYVGNLGAYAVNLVG